MNYIRIYTDTGTIHIELDDDAKVVEAVIEVEPGTGDRGPSLEFAPLKYEEEAW